MSFESNDQQLATHRSQTHIHRQSTLVVAHILPAAPRFANCYTSLKTNAASAATATLATITAAVDSPSEYSINEAGHELLECYTSDTIGELGSAEDTEFDPEDCKLDALDFSLTKRLLGAVFFLLIIYAWKQYIGDEEESDLIYI